METKDLNSIGLAYLEMVEKRNIEAKKNHAKTLDKVDPEELEGDHEDRDDKDIDNDGDVDSSDEYLHKKRKAVKKAIKKDDGDNQDKFKAYDGDDKNDQEGTKVSEDAKYPHMMYDPKTGKGYKANKEQDHKDMAKKGWTHDKPKKADIKEEADDKDPDTTFVRWLKSNYDKSPKDLNADEYAKMSKKFQASKKDESYVDTLAHKLEEAKKKKGLYYYVNKRKKAGTSRSADHPDAPSPQDWKDAAKTAKKESVEANCPKCGNPSWKTLDETEKKKGTHGKACWDGHRRGEGNSCHAVKPRKKKK